MRRGTVRLFLYGTLQPHAGTRMARWIARRQVRSEAASVPGRLFAIHAGNGWFPALVPAGSGARASESVQGTLCELALRPGELALLDRYEGGEYRRVSLPLRVAERRTGKGARAAQLYLWRIALPVGAQRISSCDFLSWLAQKRRKAFCAR